MQVLALSISEILKLKKSLSTKKIKNIQRIINNFGKSKSKINMTIKCSSKKIIILMGNDNKTKFIASLSAHITNTNSVLKNIKSNVRADLIRMDQYSIIIMMNNVASISDS